MNLSNRRKAIYITISILLAFFIWFYVNNDEQVVLSIDEIPVEFLNEETSLADKGLMLLKGDDTTVNLELRMPRYLTYRFDTSSVRLVADLSSVTSAGTQSLAYTIVYPPRVSSSDVSVKTPSVRSIPIEIGELYRKEVEIRCKLVGNVADGYMAGTVQILPEMLEVRGQQKDIMQVSYAQVTLNIENANSTIVELLNYELYDYNDQLIENRHIHPASENIQVTLPVISVKEIPLVVVMVESPGVKLSSFRYGVEPSSITLSGDASILASVDEIILDSVALEEIDGSLLKSYDIPIPEGLTNLSGTSTATLSITNTDMTTQTYEVSRFDYENLATEHSVEFVTTSLMITLRGAREDLAKLNAENIMLVADLSDVGDASGTYTVPAKVVTDDGYDVGEVGSYEVTVRLYEEAG